MPAATPKAPASWKTARWTRRASICCIEAHIRELYERLWDGLLALGITPVTPREPGGSCAAIAFTLPGAAAFYDAMRARGIIFTSSRLLRLSIAPFTTRDEIDRALAAARAALGK